MSLSYSWVELHGAVTHFPITLLILVCALDFGSFVFRKPAWRETSLLLLWVAVVMSPVALLSGYFTGREYARPPVGFDTHWKVAVLTSVLALALLAWRALSRDRLGLNARVAALSMTATCAATVGLTGHMGGQMTLGDRSEAEAAPLAAAPANVQGGQKLASAAVKMENAATQLQSATNKLATSTSQPTPASAPPANTSNIEQSAARLERAAASFEHIAERLNRIAERSPDAAPAIAPSSLPKLAQAPPTPKSASRPAGKAPAGGKIVPIPKAPPRPVVAVATPLAPTVGGVSVQLVSEGSRLMRSEDNGCLSCHKLNGEGRNKGPELTHIGQSRPSLDWHIEHLKDPAKMVPGSRMPAYDNLKTEEMRALAAYMVSLK